MFPDNTAYFPCSNGAPENNQGSLSQGERRLRAIISAMAPRNALSSKMSLRDLGYKATRRNFLSNSE